MKILIDGRVLSHSKTTGIEIHAIKLIENIRKIINVDIAKPKFTNKYYAHFWEHFILPYKLRKYDILFCPSNIAPLFVPRKVKLIYTLHDISFLDFSSNYSLFFQKYYAFIVPKNLRRADKVITVSKYAKHTILNKYPIEVRDKILYIYNGVDCFIYQNIDYKKDNYILFVGSMSKIKNYKAVIEAYKMIRNQDIKLKMVMPKIDNLKYDFQMEVKNIELIDFMNQKELFYLYKRAKLFIYPSLYDSFGLPVLEAMACGTPVVTSNVSSLPEVGGDAVVYCNPNDINDIKDKIEMVLDDEKLQEELRQKGLQRAKEFSWEKSASKHIKVFQEVMRS